MIRYFLMFYFLLLSSEAVSLQLVPMDSMSVIKVNLSYRHHNRIGIAGERIKKALFKNAHISVELEEESGQIFVQTLKANCLPTTIAIVSASGMIQDLELHFSDCSSEIVMLEPLPEMIDISNPINCVIYDQVIKELVEGFIRGSIPEGYLSIEDPSDPHLIGNGLKMIRTHRLVNNQQIIFVYRLENTSRRDMTVTECCVNILEGDWVYLDRYKLASKESAIVLIGCMR